MVSKNENIGSNPAKTIRKNAPIQKQLKNKSRTKKGPKTSHIKVNEINEALRKSRYEAERRARAEARRVSMSDINKQHSTSNPTASKSSNRNMTQTKSQSIKKTNVIHTKPQLNYNASSDKNESYAIAADVDKIIKTRKDARDQRRMERRTSKIDQRELRKALKENQKEVSRHHRESYRNLKKSQRDIRKDYRMSRQEAKRRELERIQEELRIQEHKNKVSRILGFSLGGVQILVSAIFVILLLILNMLPARFMIPIVFALLALGAATIVVHVFSKKRAIIMKVVSGILIPLLLVGSYVVNATNATVANVTTQRNIKLDTMVVVVKADDPAQTIEDAKGYTFGTQEKVKAWDVQAAVEDINQKLGITVNTKVLEGLSQQAEALFNGDVQAIVYNDAFTGLLDDTHPGFRANTRVIFEHTITTDLNHATNADFNVQMEPFAIYISGIDQRGAIDTTGRSDVNIVMIVNPNTHQVLLITTPRDYWVPIPNVSGGVPDKLTHAGIYGVQASIDTLAELYGVDIPFYVRINFTSFEKIIDALGGVDVYSELAFTTGRNSEYTVTINEGYNHLNGRQALAFSRERKGLADGDLQRGRNQQAVITAMIQRATSPAILTGATQILASIQDNMDTNMAMDQVQNLIRMQLHTGAQWDVISVSAEGTFARKVCFSMPGVPLSVVVPDQVSVDAIRAQVQKIMSGEMIKDESTPVLNYEGPAESY